MVLSPEFQVLIRDATHSQSYGQGAQPVVGPISMNIRKGEFLVFLGPASCGKTMLIKMLAGLAPVTAGEIRMSGETTSGTPRAVGLVTHNPALLPWRTTMGNILLQAEIQGLDLSESCQSARRLLAWFGLSRLEERRAHEIPKETVPAIALCRALVESPSLLLLDEPFRQLDLLAMERILDVFQRLWAQNRTTAVLCTTNIQEAVLLADRVAILSARPGRLLDCLAVDLPRPRRLDKSMAPQIAEYCNRIRMLFRAQGILP